jgi:hypothetical protein
MLFVTAKSMLFPANPFGFSHLCVHVWLLLLGLFKQLNFFVASIQSTYCSSLYRHCETAGRSINIVNLDPAAEQFDYPVAMGESS